jgi:hypothetical protein
MIKQWIATLAGTKWLGTGELWLDPEGNIANQCSCELTIDKDAIHYIWSYKNESQKGSFAFNESGAIWSDSWHQQKPVQCLNVPLTWGLFTVIYEYDVPENPNWAWQSKLSQRPDDSLVLQMTNIAPWGEEGRAVRMVFSRTKP